jgi:PAS domain S-box-containing protein
MASIAEWRTETEFLVRSIRGIVWEADPKTIQFTYVSEDAERILGYAREEWLLGGFWANHIHPEDRQWVVEECARATAAGKHHEFEYRMIAADGRAVRLRDTVFVDMQHGKPTRLRGILVDISTQGIWGSHSSRNNSATWKQDCTRRRSWRLSGSLPRAPHTTSTTCSP